MARYCVNKGGDHEVHQVANCSWLPNIENRIDFNAASDRDAMVRARSYYPNADGCAHCMSAYHTR